MHYTLATLLAALSLLITTHVSAQSWPDLAKPTSSPHPKTQDAALIIGIEDYAFVADIPGALQNAQDWYIYFTQGRRVPSQNVRFLKDASASREKILKHAEELTNQVQKGGTLWVIFIGHGAPAKDGKDGLLVGMDAQQDPDSLYARSLAQQDLIDVLKKGKQTHTVLIVDACFSGKTAENTVLAKDLQPLLPVHTHPQRVTVLSAGKSDEFAGPLPGAARPAFSYLLLGALRGWGDENEDGDVTAAEAIGYTRNVLQSLILNRSQTPQVSGRAPKLILTRSTKERGPNIPQMILEIRSAALPKNSTESRSKNTSTASCNSETTCTPLCTRNDMRACYTLGTLYKKGKGVSKDTYTSRKMFEKACKGDDLRACHSLGVLYAEGDGVVINEGKAFQLFKTSYERGHTKSAGYLGWMYEHAKGTPQNLRKAFDLNTIACKRGMKNGCNNLGMLHYQGKGVPQDYNKARRIFEETCERGSPSSCYNLASLYVDGKGVSKDYREARRLFESACTQNHAKACGYLGWMYKKGKGVSKHQKRAKAYYATACKRGDTKSCLDLKKLK